jgi:hypothetical protein
VIVVAGLAAAGVVIASGDDTDPTVESDAAAVTTTAPPPTTTTLPASPDALSPPTSVEATAAAFTRIERAIRGDDRDPARLRVLGWEQQLTYRQLSVHPDWTAPVVALLPPDVAAIVTANLDASAALSKLVEPAKTLPDWTIVTPPAPEILKGFYAEGERTYGIPWVYLAAIHLVETRMGRIRGNSTAGAQGPMQFIPSTWAAYGDGGDVNDPHDAILAAARYLKAAGGPSDMDKAIFAYNHDRGYVVAIKTYAAQMLADARAFDGYYHWQVYYRTVDGTVLLPEGFGAGQSARPIPTS